MSWTIVVPLLGPRQGPKGISERALPVARALSERIGANVLLVSVVEVAQELGACRDVLGSTDSAERRIGEAVTERQQYLDQVVASFAGRRPKTVVRDGDTATEVLDVLEGLERPILVMASHGRLGISRILSGSVAFDVMHQTRYPIVLVRQPVPDRWSPRSIIAALDRSAFAEQALETALVLLDGEDLDVHLIHVVDYLTPDDPRSAQQRLNHYLSEVATRVPRQLGAVSWEVREGSVASEIIKASLERGAGLIVMATHRRTGINRLLLGSVAERVVHAAPIPVLLVQPDEASLARVETEREIEPARRLTVRDIMVAPVITVREDDPLEEIASKMLQHRIGGVPVVDQDGRLVGIVSESDFTRTEQFVPFSAYRAPVLFGQWLPKEDIERIYELGRTMTAREIMSTRVVTATEDQPVSVLIDLMIEHDVHRIPVVRDQVVTGMVTRHDLLRLMLSSTTS